jgi:hypothetical protein
MNRTHVYIVTCRVVRVTNKTGQVKVKVNVTLRLTVSQSESLDVKAPSEAHGQIFIIV